MARRRPGPAVGKTKEGWHNYTTQASADRGLLREMIDMDIGSYIRRYSAGSHVQLTLLTVYKTGDPGAGMRWEALAFQELVIFYGIILRGWPPHVTFQNRSDMPIADIRYLLELFEFGYLYFLSPQGDARRAPRCRREHLQRCAVLPLRASGHQELPLQP